MMGTLLVACTSEPEDKPMSKPKEVKNDIETQVTDFSKNKFEDEKSLELLQELDFCVLKDSLGIIAECSPKNFELIPFKNDVPLEDAFILKVKAGVLLKGSMEPLPPVRHIFVFERENGKLVKVNGFRGDIIATSAGARAKDLILALYLKEDETLFHCRYVWDGKKYVFKSVEGLDYGEGVRVISESKREEVTNDIYNAIMQSNLIF